MTATESDPTSAAESTTVITLETVRSFYASRGVNFGDLTGDQADRELYAPMLMDMIFDAADRATDGEAIGMFSRQTAREILVTHLEQRLTDRRAYRSLEETQLAKVPALLAGSPELAVAQQVATVLGRTDIGPYTNNILVAMSVAVEEAQQGIIE